MSTEVEEIQNLIKLIEIKKKSLFLNRLKRMYKNLPDDTLSSICITTDVYANTWNITYLHTTDKYNSFDYSYNDDSDNDEVTIIHKKTEISVGFNKKYYILGGNIPINVYRTQQTREFRITNNEYLNDIDYDDQKTLINNYSTNVNLPEWMALNVLLYINDNNWDDDSPVKYFSVI